MIIQAKKDIKPNNENLFKILIIRINLANVINQD